MKRWRVIYLKNGRIAVMGFDTEREARFFASQIEYKVLSIEEGW